MIRYLKHLLLLKTQTESVIVMLTQHFKNMLFLVLIIEVNLINKRLKWIQDIQYNKSIMQLERGYCKLANTW